MSYAAYVEHMNAGSVGYATSEDGLHWRKGYTRRQGLDDQSHGGSLSFVEDDEVVVRKALMNRVPISQGIRITGPQLSVLEAIMKISSEHVH
jgi:hypothetical protein